VKASGTQAAADAAVMAAGLMLPVSQTDTARQAEITKTAEDYLEKNGAVLTDDVTITFGNLVNGMYHSIDVSLPAVSETSFARIFGVTSIAFTREAEGRTIPCTSLSDLVPLSVREDVLEALIASGNTSHVVLKYGKNTEEVVQGAFGAIDLDGVKGGGANDYCTWLSNGYSGQLTVGTVLPVEPGHMCGPTLAGVSARYNACTHFQSDGGCTAEHYVANCPRVMKVPVVVYLSSQYVEIVGFAAFVLEDYTTYATEGYVVGTYVDMVNMGSVGGDITGTADSFGVYNLTLSK